MLSQCGLFQAIMCVNKSAMFCVTANGDSVSTNLLTVSLTRQERGLLKMHLIQQTTSPSRPATLLIADMYGTGIAISDKLQVLHAVHSVEPILHRPAPVCNELVGNVIRKSYRYKQPNSTHRVSTDAGVTPQCPYLNNSTSTKLCITYFIH